MKQALSKYKFLYLVLLIVLVFFITSVIVAIFLVDKKEDESQITKSNYQTDLSKLESNINNALLDSDKETVTYNRIKLNLEKAKKATEDQDKYDSFFNVAENVMILYSLTNNPNLYSIINDDINKIAEEYFPTQYQQEKYLFQYPCQDKNCAEDPQPVEIINIIEDINASDIDDDIKKSFITDLTNAGFFNDEKEKISLYFHSLNNIKFVPNSSPTNSNQEIANELERYLEKTYPEEYIDWQKTVELSEKAKENNEE